MICEEELKKVFDIKSFELNEKGKYEGFWQDIGYNRKWFSPESSYFWVEDLVVDLLIKEKVFGDKQILLTRNYIGKELQHPLRGVFKGPISPVDIWIPGYGFGEVKFTGDSQKDIFGYDLDNRSIKNIYQISNLEFSMESKFWKDNKIFLFLVHNPGPGDKISVSIIDLKEKFSFSPNKKEENKSYFNINAQYIKIGVNDFDCFKRFDGVPFRKFQKRCYADYEEK